MTIVSTAREDQLPNKNQPGPYRIILLSELWLLLALALQICLIILMYRFNFFNIISQNVASDFCASYVFSGVTCTTLAGAPPALLMSAIILTTIQAIRGRIKPLISSIRVKKDLNLSFASFLLLNILGFSALATPYILLNVLGNADRPLLQATWLAGSIAMFGAPILQSALSGGLVRKLRTYQLVTVAFSVLVIAFIPSMESFIAQRLWLDTFLKDWTINLVLMMLQVSGQPHFFIEPMTMGVDNFSVSVGFPCAGLSGIVFSSLLTTGFILASRKDLHFLRASVLIPIAAILSWISNSLRIFILLLIGEYISPELAVDGFHSYAGWISLTVVTGFLMLSATRVAWFHRKPELTLYRGQSILQNPAAAKIVPFGVLMFTLLLFGAFSSNPDQLYPFRISVVATALLLFWRCVPKILPDVMIDPMIILCSVFVAALWITFNQPTPISIAQLVPELSAASLFIWILFRFIGTAIVIPAVEELFFRAYLIEKIKPSRFGSPAIALIFSSIVFGALHANMFLGTIAGLVFGCIYLRRRNVMDPILCHALTNIMVFLWALYFDDWSVI